MAQQQFFQKYVVWWLYTGTARTHPFAKPVLMNATTLPVSRTLYLLKQSMCISDENLIYFENMLKSYFKPVGVNMLHVF